MKEPRVHRKKPFSHLHLKQILVIGKYACGAFARVSKDSKARRIATSDWWLDLQDWRALSRHGTAMHVVVGPIQRTA